MQALQAVECLTGYQKMMKAVDRMNSIRNAADLEAVYLRGEGLSPNTYLNYSRTVKQFYEFTEGLIPLQVTAGHVEQFYDHILKSCDQNTAVNKMSGLKKFFEGVKREVPFFENPFDTMSEQVKKKISKQHTKSKTKAALTLDEWNRVKTFLEADTSIKGLQNYAMVMTLYSTGLRAFELCGLKWSDLSKDDEGFYITGTGKGGNAFCQYVPENVVRAVYEAFRARFNSEPKEHEHVFYGLESYHGKPASPINKSILWVRLRDIGIELKEQKAIRKDLEFSAHLFRRSSITHLNKKGVDMKTLRNFSRHSSMEVLYNNYVDSREQPRAEIDKLAV